MGQAGAQAPSAVPCHLPVPSGPRVLHHFTLLLAEMSAPGAGQGLPAFGRVSAGCAILHLPIHIKLLFGDYSNIILQFKS